MKGLNFQTGTKDFKKGWYSYESNIGYLLIYKDVFRNINKINNSGLMLELFNELPKGATLNKKKL